MLAVAARFHRYSPNNVLLILAQRPEAAQVAGYRTWKSLGRQVRKGERGIAILAPVVAKRTDEQVTEPDQEQGRVLRGFRVTHVFDVDQTDGPELPNIGPNEVQTRPPAWLWQRLAAQVADAGYSLDRGETAPAYGYVDHNSRHVRIRADVPIGQACKTLAHEISHIHLHPNGYPPGERPRCEVEAESVAYIVSSVAGLPSDEYSVPYVAGWSGGDVTELRKTAERVLGTAQQIITAAGLNRDETPDSTSVPELTRQLTADRSIA
jgi:hypothetical protein